MTGDSPDSIRTIDFLAWMGTIVVALTLYAVLDWGTKRRWGDEASDGPESPSAPSGHATILSGTGPEDVRWVLQRVHDEPARDEFERQTLSRRFGFGENDLDFWQLWVLWNGSEALALDRSSLRVQLSIGGEQVPEVPLERGSSGLAPEDRERLLPLFALSGLGSAETQPILLPPRSAIRILVAFERGRSLASDIHAASILGAPGGISADLRPTLVPRSDLVRLSGQPSWAELSGYSSHSAEGD